MKEKRHNIWYGKDSLCDIPMFCGAKTLNKPVLLLELRRNTTLNW